ncbi:MAG: hypothetical protein ABSF82_00670 [Candidatus Bathyarchaeia archaeon]|jgi:hypothetical protein
MKMQIELDPEAYRFACDWFCDFDTNPEDYPQEAKLLDTFARQLKAAKPRIETIQELQTLASQSEGVSVFLLFAGGIRSSKHVWHKSGRWCVLNLIDSTDQKNLTDQQLESESDIPEAIRKGALFAEFD